MNRRNFLMNAATASAGLALSPSPRIFAQEANPWPDEKPAYNPHKAPLYWTVYEYMFKYGRAIPEEEFKKNIDWMADNLRDYGYKMVATDGGEAEGSETVNEDGYQTRYGADWQHDYAWWSKYLQSKGMKLGVYMNPLWAPYGAVKLGKLIKGTNIPISSICDPDGKDSFIHVEKPGAEQWIRGYVQYLGSIGVAFLRVDFLCYYENGQDTWAGKVASGHPHWMYAAALRWMREECDKYGIILSLVMINNFNDAATEQAFGHMIRIDQDAGRAGWWWFSENTRGLHYYGWSQYFDTFDGFVYWSRISGRHKMILDGDFTRLNCFDTAEERKSVVSLQLVAGGPIAVADRYNSIDQDLWIYQNREMLALNEDGFVGKPISNDPVNPRSQIWTGQMNNGDWILALFNREADPKTYDLKFADHGIEGSFHVRDLWAHSDLGVADAHKVTLGKHACQILRLIKA